MTIWTKESAAVRSISQRIGTFRSESDMEISSDSEEEISRDPYSLDSSPHDEEYNHVTIRVKNDSHVRDASHDLSEINDSDTSRKRSHLLDMFWSTKSRKKSHNQDFDGVRPAVKNPKFGSSDESGRISSGAEASSPPSLIVRHPSFYASGLSPWHTVISYDACVRLCLHLSDKGFSKARIFLDKECALLQNSFSLQNVLLPAEEEFLKRPPSDVVDNVAAAPKPKKATGKMKVQVRKLKLEVDLKRGCSFPPFKSSKVNMENIQLNYNHMKSAVSSGWKAIQKVHVDRRVPANGSFSQKTLSYIQTGVKDVSEFIKGGVASWRSSSSSSEVILESYSCLLRLRSSSNDEVVRMQPGSGETHVFFPENLSEVLVVEVEDSKGKNIGRVLVQVATITDDPGEKLRWWSIYQEPEHELVGRIQLYICYSIHSDENAHLKCGSVAETVAYDVVLEAAMKAQQFRQRNLILYDPWKWLIDEFASYYGVSVAYTNLRYLSYIMDVATPTADCLVLVHDLLKPLIMNGNRKDTLSYQEKRILGEVVDQVDQILALVFENYKSLDESELSGMVDGFRQSTGNAAPAMAAAVKVYNLLNDMSTPEVQLTLHKHFQVAVKKRSRKHVAETDEFVSNNNDIHSKDPSVYSKKYEKMVSICRSMRNEILTDIQIHNRNIMPSFIDLRNISSSIYNTDLCCRIREFLVACPPTGPSPAVIEFFITTSDFEQDLSGWKLDDVKGGVNAKELFHSHISHWIEEKRHTLLDCCKLDKVKWSGVRTQYATTPFTDDMYDRLMETMNQYEIIISRWPEFIPSLEKALADVEKAILDALDKQYADVLLPLKDKLTTKFLGNKYVKKFAKGTVSLYSPPDDLGILFNSLRRMIDVLRPKIESRLTSWNCHQKSDDTIHGEHFSEVTVMLRAKFRNYSQAVAEKLAENTRLQKGTRIRSVIKDMKDNMLESEIESRTQGLKDILVKTMEHLHSIFETSVFISLSRCFWDRMGQDVLSFVDGKRNDNSLFKGSRILISIVDHVFVSEMQQLVGYRLQPKELEPPRSILEVRSILCKDSTTNGDTYC